MRLRAFARVAVGVAVVVLLLYAAEDVSLRLRMASHRDATSTVDVQVVLAIPRKDGRTEFAPGDTVTETCVRSVFPHLGMAPCWYLRRHTTRQINY